MIFLIASIVVPILVYFFTPLILSRVTGHQPKHNGILLTACLIFFISWYVPSPLIDGESTQFSTHFIGGGIFTGFLWWYILKNLGHKMHWFTATIFLYFLVSGLGVLNELFELGVAKFGIEEMSLTDTSWDLFANTLGALVFWLFYQLVLLLKRK
jgi:hypothetical protein